MLKECLAKSEVYLIVDVLSKHGLHKKKTFFLYNANNDPYCKQHSNLHNNIYNYMLEKVMYYKITII